MISPHLPLERPSTGSLIAGGVAAGYLGGLALLMNRVSYDIWGALVIGPALVVLTIPLFRHVARLESDPPLAWLLFGALLAKFAGAFAQYVTVYVVYAGNADATLYDKTGKALADSLRHGSFADLGEISGTRFVEIVTGVVYAVIGPTNLGGFLVFSWLSFLGFVLFYRAFRIALPTGDHRRYRVLLFFLPSLLFWPAAIGKEALMLALLGACAYGLARILTQSWGGLAWLGLGLWGASVIRPHMALLVLTAAIPAILLPKGGRERSDASTLPLTKVVVALVVIGATTLLAARAQEFFNLESLDSSSAETVLADTGENTERGGSEFDAPNAASPAGYVLALVTILFRPFPFEANSIPTLLSAIEGVGMVVLIYLSRRRLVRLPSQILSRAYVRFCVTYGLVFVYIFSVFSNFGLLARQRTQLFPLVLVLLALDANAQPKAPDAPAKATRGPPPPKDLVPVGARHVFEGHQQ